jgi:hypothetical protein
MRRKGQSGSPDPASRTGGPTHQEMRGAAETDLTGPEFWDPKSNKPPIFGNLLIASSIQLPGDKGAQGQPVALTVRRC